MWNNSYFDIKTLFDLFELQPTVKEAKNPKFFEFRGGKIEIQNISFRYNETNKPIFKKFSLAIQPKELTFIVGKSGAGKSTLFNLFVFIVLLYHTFKYRFYDPEKGKITIDG